MQGRVRIVVNLVGRKERVSDVEHVRKRLPKEQLIEKSGLEKSGLLLVSAMTVELSGITKQGVALVVGRSRARGRLTGRNTQSRVEEVTRLGEKGT